MDTFTAEAAAAIIGSISASTVRNWCKIYAAILSPAANPPVGSERRLTQSDVATLQQVRVMREAKRSVEDIVITLQQAATRLQPSLLTIEAIATPPPSPQEGRSDDFPLTVALSSMEKRQDTTDARVADIARSLVLMEQRQAAKVDTLVTGIVIGGALVLIIVALVLGLAQ